MGLSSSKPFQIFLSDIFQKYDDVQLVAVVKSLFKITVSLKSHLIKKANNIAAKILTLLIKLCLLTVPTKDSLNFLSDYYFDTKSPVAFTSPLAFYREAKNVIFPLLFIKLKLGYNPKISTPYINQFGIIFRKTESLLQRLMVSGKQI